MYSLSALVNSNDSHKESVHLRIHTHGRTDGRAHTSWYSKVGEKTWDSGECRVPIWARVLQVPQPWAMTTPVLNVLSWLVVGVHINFTMTVWFACKSTHIRGSAALPCFNFSTGNVWLFPCARCNRTKAGYLAVDMLLMDSYGLLLTAAVVALNLCVSAANELCREVTFAARYNAARKSCLFSASNFSLFYFNFPRRG